LRDAETSRSQVRQLGIARFEHDLERFSYITGAMNGINVPTFIRGSGVSVSEE
jgi:hypothetical protein